MAEVPPRPLPERPLVLGVETSGVEGGVSLLRGADVLASERLSAAGGKHGRELHLAMDRVLSSSGVRPEGVEIVAVSLGPGSFTGLRLGVAAAKTWAWATGCRLAGVPTFEALAAPLAGLGDRPPRWWIIADALRGELFVQPFEFTTGRLAPAGPLRLFSADAWRDEQAPGDGAAGPAVDRLREGLAKGGLVLAPPELCTPSAESVARCGLDRILTGREDDPVTLLPLYVRRSAAEEKRDATAPPKAAP